MNDQSGLRMQSTPCPTRVFRIAFYCINGANSSTQTLYQNNHNTFSCPFVLYKLKFGYKTALNCVAKVSLCLCLSNGKSIMYSLFGSKNAVFPSLPQVEPE